MNVHTAFVVAAAPAVILLAAACRTRVETTYDIPSVTNFDLVRYQGKWHEFARFPHSFEYYLLDPGAVYTMRPDGKVEVVNYGYDGAKRREARAVARMKGDPKKGELRVSFFRPFYADYRIIALAPDYSSAIVTSGTKDYLWILSREPRLDPATHREYLDKLERWGFNTKKLQYPIRNTEK